MHDIHLSVLVRCLYLMYATCSMTVLITFSEQKHPREIQTTNCYQHLFNAIVWYIQPEITELIIKV